MNQYLKIALETNHERRPFFTQVLNSFNNQAINVCVVGVERNLDPRSIFGEGWFSAYAGDYIRRNGGRLTLVDIDPIAIKNAQIILSDFLDIITVVNENGYDYLRKNNNFDLVYLDSSDHPNFMYEEYRALNRTKTTIFCDDFASKGIRLRQCYLDFELLKCPGGHEMGLYKKIDNFGHETFSIGCLTLPYYRGWKGNSEGRNHRSIEIPLIQWFANKYNNEILELGDISPAYETYQNWRVLDPYGPFKNSIRKDVLDFDYTGLNISSCSTWEHFSESAYGNTDKDKPIKALIKIAKEAKNWLITFDIGADRYFEDWLMNQNQFQYTFMVRNNIRGDINNWHQSNDKNNFYLEYAHFELLDGGYGNAKAICLLGNQQEIFNL